MNDRVAALRVLHPFPSLLNAVLVFGLALLARAAPLVAAGLALAMLLLQFCIGAVNDLADERFDATRPGKPLPGGLISRRGAAILAIGAGGGGLLLAALFGALPLLVALAGLGAGLAYDLWLKRGPWAWLSLATALPLLPVFAWYGAAGTLPPRAEVLLPLAALAGPALQLANGLVDIERDRVAGLRTLPVMLGQRRASLLMAALLLIIHALAWALLPGGTGLFQVYATMTGAGLLAVSGIGLSASASATTREWGWRIQAGATAVLALAWLAAVT